MTLIDGLHAGDKKGGVAIKRFIGTHPNIPPNTVFTDTVSALPWGDGANTF